MRPRGRNHAWVPGCVGQSLGVLQDGARGSRQDGARGLNVGRCDAGRGQEPSRPSTCIWGVIWLDLFAERGSQTEGFERFFASAKMKCSQVLSPTIKIAQDRKITSKSMYGVTQSRSPKRKCLLSNATSKCSSKELHTALATTADAQTYREIHRARTKHKQS